MTSLPGLIFSGMSRFCSGLMPVGIGSVLIKAMKDEGYDAEFSAAVTGA